MPQNAGFILPMAISQIRLFFVLLFIFCSATCISQNLDINILKGINPDVPGSSVWRGFSSSVSPVIIGLPIGMYLVNHFKKNPGGKTDALHIAGGILTSLAFTQAMKYSINRDRPFITYPLDVHPFSNSETGLSFPSQHTSFAFATAMTLSLHYKKWYVAVPAFAWATGVGYSRLYLGQHYPSDVIAGAALGTGSALLSEWLTKKIWPQNHR
ncbi:MAG: phosphatase PAP2 family protein [Chitinophagaceae bacterium]|nr:MAG: phosphatase PAP2 family protein [Chitinophagaceae bacterium]